MLPESDPDWTRKAEFMKAAGATSASWDVNGVLLFLVLSEQTPPAPSTIETTQPAKKSPEQVQEERAVEARRLLTAQGARLVGRVTG